MNKRLSRSDYMFALIFIFMLVFALGTFFFGLKLGQDRTTAKYEDAVFKKNQEAQGYAAYDQQYLVSYYHTIYQPYREFHKTWFEQLNELELHKSSDSAMVLKNLSKLAKEKYDELSTKSMPDSSPLLQEGQQNYAKSLKLFSEALDNITVKANGMPTKDLLDYMEKDSYLTEAQKFALAAQKNYYDSIIKWNEANDPQLKKADASKPLPLADWNALNLNAKNDYIANALAAAAVYKPFTPQDLSIRIDELIASGQAKKMNLATIQQVSDALMATDAVRTGDYILNKNKWYPNETLPQLPFFFSQN
jgi:hypothetical protein